MSMRVRTIRELARRKRAIARVRWRCWEKDGDAPVVVDSDGNEKLPGTWQRWEEEYFLQVDLARAALPKEPHAHLRPRGIIDQVPARDVWAEMVREARLPGGDPESIEDYDDGLLRVLYSMQSGPWRLACDRVREGRVLTDC